MLFDRVAKLHIYEIENCFDIRMLRTWREVFRKETEEDNRNPPPPNVVGISLHDVVQRVDRRRGFLFVLYKDLGDLARFLFRQPGVFGFQRTTSFMI